MLNNVPKIYESKGVYGVRYYTPEGKRTKKSFGTHNIQVAQEELKKFIADYDSGKIRFDTYNLKEYLDQKLSEFKQTKSEDFHRRASRVSVYLVEFFGSRKCIQDITRTDVRNFRNYRISLGNVGNSYKQKPLSNKSVNNDIQVAKTIFEDAYQDELIDENPFRFLKKLPHIPETVDAFTEEEFIKIMNNAPDIYRRVYHFLMLTGCRKGEAVELKWKDIDFTNELIFIRKENTKSKRPKVLPLTPDIKAIFA